ncbi:MAG: hypothetical protein HQM06_11545 [Magnetococcales bacterium]|nr:hypothetical protein [Magnetococcales bacterium]
MDTSLSVLQENNQRRIKVNGLFDAQLREQFEAAYATSGSDTGAALRYVVDLSMADVNDISALGMLLMMHASVGQGRQKIAISRMNEKAKSWIMLNHVDDLFDVVYECTGGDEKNDSGE